MAENQLLAEAEGTPDLDEFEGMSTRDIAASIALWPDGSEDQQRALAALRARAPGIGHNRPPLDETIDDEIAPLRARATELIDVAAKAVIIDDVSAGKVTDLIAMMRGLERDLEAAREKRVRPYIDGQRLVNAKFSAVMTPLSAARQGENGRGGLRGALTAYDDKREREAEAERQRLRAEAEERERQAAAAREAAQRQTITGGWSVPAELEALRAADEAARLTERAEAIRPDPIRSHLGQVNRRRDVRFNIENLRLALGWLVKQDGLRNNLTQAVNTILGAHFRAIGVDAVERGVSIPGVRVWIEKGAANVRR
jgi:hypothetical protein